MPKSWKLHSSCEAPLTTDLVDDCLSYQFAAMNVKDNPGKPSSSVRYVITFQEILLKIIEQFTYSLRIISSIDYL